MVSTRKKTWLLLSSVAMLATPAVAQASSKTHDFSDDRAEFTSVRQTVKPRKAKAQRVVKTPSSHATAATAGSGNARAAKALGTTTHHAKAPAKTRQIKQAKQPSHFNQVTRYEAYLDRHGVEPSTYTYVSSTPPARPARRSVARVANPAAVVSADRTEQRTTQRAARSAARTEVRAPTRAVATSAAPASTEPHQWGATSRVVAEARRYIGTNPTGRSAYWCAYFMNMVLERTGYEGTRSGLAKSFASYGTRVSGPQIGAIAVMTRRGRNAAGGPGGHVGVVSGIDPSGNPIIISGNHNKRVAEAVYPRARIYAYVMP